MFCISTSREFSRPVTGAPWRTSPWSTRTTFLPFFDFRWLFFAQNFTMQITTSTTTSAAKIVLAAINVVLFRDTAPTQTPSLSCVSSGHVSTH